MKAVKIGHRWQIIDGNDLVVVWLDGEGFNSQRVSNFQTNPIGREVSKISNEDLILAAEGQKKLL